MSEVLEPKVTDISFANVPAVIEDREHPVAEIDNDPATAVAISAAKAELNYEDSQSFVFFGAQAQTGLSEIARKMIAGARNKDIGPAAESLSRIVLNIRGFSVADLKDHSGAWGIFKERVLRVATPIAAAFQRYEKVQTQIGAVVADLDQHVGIMMKDVAGLDRMYAEALVSFRKLKIYIAVGEAELADIRDVRLPALRKKAESGDPMAVQDAARLEGLSQRLERRVHDFKLTRQATLQSLPMIMLMQDNESNLIEKIQSTIANTIPLWEQRIAMLITARHAESAAAASSHVSDLNNDLLVDTAQAMRDSNRKVRTEVERGIFDIGAIRSANDTAIATLDEATSIYETAAKRRREEAAELEKFEAAIRTALLGGPASAN